jgi:hypothetical protein
MSERLGSEYHLLPARLPGHFSVRGDWFLAVANGSQSLKLADRALDLLSSRRANVRRLQLGLGLPVRKLVEDHKDSFLRTSLFSVNKDGLREPVHYNDLVALGAESALEHAHGDSFYWLFRSSIGNYDSHSRVWQKWLVRILLWWKGLLHVQGTQWRSGFALYDALDEYYDAKTSDDRRRELFDTAFQVQSIEQFPQLIDFLLDGLRGATPRMRSE